MPCDVSFHDSLVSMAQQGTTFFTCFEWQGIWISPGKQHGRESSHSRKTRLNVTGAWTTHRNMGVIGSIWYLGNADWIFSGWRNYLANWYYLDGTVWHSLCQFRSKRGRNMRRGEDKTGLRKMLCKSETAPDSQHILYNVCDWKKSDEVFIAYCQAADTSVQVGWRWTELRKCSEYKSSSFQCSAVWWN